MKNMLINISRVFLTFSIKNNSFINILCEWLGRPDEIDSIGQFTIGSWKLVQAKCESCSIALQTLTEKRRGMYELEFGLIPEPFLHLQDFAKLS